MPAQAKVRFLQFIQKDDTSRFGLFRCADDTMTHIMGKDGFWVALPENDDDALNDMIHHMMVDKLLPQFREVETDEQESPAEPDWSDGDIANESDELSVRVFED